VEQLVLSEVSDRVAILTLHRAQRHNSLVPELLRALMAALDAAVSKPDLRAVVLQADGRSFSTGGDVGAFFDHRAEITGYAAELVSLLNETIMAMVRLPVPVVAAVHGIVTGGSLGLVLASDLVLLTPDASFTPFYGVVGFSPDGGWTAMLPQLIGVKRATEALLLNRSIQAPEAVAWGLANRVVPVDRIREEARTVAEAIANMKSGSIRRTRRLLWPDTAQLAARLEQERQAFLTQVATPEALQGMEAFLCKH
jgi:2-(1,2-epoxy-1,2-dihydrophenyl)acetyl-CoA isomerase